LIVLYRVSLKQRNKNFKRSLKEKLEVIQKFYQEIRRKDPRVLLQYLGIPYKDYGWYLMFRAPWREDKNPSVSWHRTLEGEWLFVDHGDEMFKGDHGNFLEFLGMDKSSAREELQRIYGLEIEDLEKEVGCSKIEVSDLKFNFNKNNKEKVERDKEKVFQMCVKSWAFCQIDAAPEQGRKLLQRYMKEWKEERNFDWWDLKDIAFLVCIGKAWKIGFKNISGGWELLDLHLRVGCRKMSIGKKDIFFQKGLKKKVYVVESVLDGLAIRKVDLGSYILSLNGVGLVKRAVWFIREKISKDYEVILALDQDQAGRESSQKIVRALRGYFVRKALYLGKDPSEGWKKYGRYFLKKVVSF